MKISCGDALAQVESIRSISRQQKVLLTRKNVFAQDVRSTLHPGIVCTSRSQFVHQRICFEPTLFFHPGPSLPIGISDLIDSFYPFSGKIDCNNLLSAFLDIIDPIRQDRNNRQKPYGNNNDDDKNFPKCKSSFP